MTVFWRALKKTVFSYVKVPLQKGVEDSRVHPMRKENLHHRLNKSGSISKDSKNLADTKKRDADLFNALRQGKKAPNYDTHRTHNHKDQCYPKESMEKSKEDRMLSLSAANDYDVLEDDESPSQNTHQISVRGINGGDFIVCHRIINPKPFPRKPPLVKRLQLLGVLSLFALTFLTHTWVLVEQHIVRRLLTPVGIVLTGFFLSSGDSQAQENTKKNEDNNTIKPPPASKEEGKMPEAEKNTPSKEGGEKVNPPEKQSTPSEKSSQKEATTAKSNDKTALDNKVDKKNNTKTETVSFDPLSLNNTQVQILLSLHDRDQNLKKLEESFREKEAAHSALNAAMDKQLKDKRTELFELKKMVEALAQTTNKDTMENVKKMVTIYESMKAEEASKIFNELPHVVLVGLMKKMNPKKASAILARMDVEKTKAITNTFSLAPYIPTVKNEASGKKK